MKQTTLDSSLNELSIDALIMQIGCMESPQVLFLLVLSLYGENGHGFATVQSCYNHCWIELTESCLLILECLFGKYSAEKLVKFGGLKSLLMVTIICRYISAIWVLSSLCVYYLLLVLGYGKGSTY